MIDTTAYTSTLAYPDRWDGEKPSTRRYAVVFPLNSQHRGPWWRGIQNARQVLARGTSLHGSQIPIPLAEVKRLHLQLARDLSNKRDTPTRPKTGEPKQ